MVICPRLKDPSFLEGNDTPTTSGLVPFLFHCEQGQKVGLLGSVPLDLGNGYQMGYVLPSPRSRGESLIQLYPIGSQTGPPFHLHQDSLGIPSCSHILPLGLREGCFFGDSPSHSK